ncbi:MAG TPA: hypothetical protein DC047_09360 [Blastocatellia bacterium]|nr:hypothetical protein [Blastocatellia bacterium]
MHEDPVTKSKRVTDASGNVVSTVETDPWGADTPRSSNVALQPKKFTSYERDANGSDEAMFRRYNRWHSRFDQPDPYQGSYSLTDPQSFNRYAYTRGNPVSFVDPTGLDISLPGIPFLGPRIGPPPSTVNVPISFDWAIDAGFSSGGRGLGFGVNRLRPLPLDPPTKGGSNGGGETGKAPQGAPKDDCHRFADLIQGIAERTSSDTEFLDELARTFTSANNSSIREMRDNSGGPVNPPRLSFGVSGFKPQFQDNSNQVRHFVAGFIAGADLGIPGLLFMNSREDQENADTRLNGVSTNLGSWFTGQPSSLEFRRARLADQFRKDVCQK